MAIIERITEKEIRELMQIELSRRCKDASGGGCTSLLIDEDTCIHVPVEKCPQKMALLKKRKIELPAICRSCKHNGVWVINPCNYYNCYESECTHRKSFALDTTPAPDLFLFRLCCWHIRTFGTSRIEKQLKSYWDLQVLSIWLSLFLVLNLILSGLNLFSIKGLVSVAVLCAFVTPMLVILIWLFTCVTLALTKTYDLAIDYIKKNPEMKGNLILQNGLWFLFLAFYALIAS